MKFLKIIMAANIAALSLSAAFGESSMQDRFSTQTLETQVYLDRALFSPGSIDGMSGENTTAALEEFQKAHKLKPTGELDTETSDAVVRSSDVDNYLRTYIISTQDSRVHFISIPKKTTEKAELDSLSYTTMTEMLGERFHSSPELLRYLNPGVRWELGTTVSVPNVADTWIRTTDFKRAKSEKKKGKTETNEEPLSPGLSAKPDGPVTVVVTKSDTSLRVFDKGGKVIFYAPVTAGSSHDPLPLGDWKVNGTERYPIFHFNPDLFWDAKDSDSKAKLPPGPNNPVGVMWIDLNKAHYGIHGTPEPETIGYAESHGCVRMTNWDVMRLSDMVKPGTKVKFLAKPE